MESVCARCARLAVSGHRAAAPRTVAAVRSLSTTPSFLAQDGSGDRGVASSGKPMTEAVRGGKANNAQRPLIRRMVQPDSQPSGERQERAPVLRRTTSSSGSAPILRKTPSLQGGQLPRRSPSQSADGQGQGQVLRRTGAPPGGSFLRRTPGAAGGRPGGARSGTGARSQQGRSQDPKIDKRRRRERREGADEDEVDTLSLNQQMDEFITKHVDRPPNPTEPLHYNPAKLSLDDLKSDWPNTPMTASGMTESVVQKIEWLARRLPHGYQYPEQIVEHYLKGNLTRFESEEEKQTVLKLASELTAKSKKEFQETVEARKAGDKTKPFIFPAEMRFQMVKDPKFRSLSERKQDRDFLLDTSVKGDYGEVEKQKYPFLQNAAKVLVNNGTYGPTQMQKVLDRVQMLIPQRGAAQRQAQKA